MRMAAVVLLLCAAGWSQDAAPLAKGACELGIWTGGGSSVPGGTRDVQAWNAGVRIGKVLTAEHGPGFLRGTLEYAADVIPVYLVFHSGTSYAAGVTPLLLKWNMGSGRVRPYFEAGGGVLFSPDEIPAGTSQVNFTPQAAVGVHLLRGDNRAITLAARYVHISSAGLGDPNPGINTVQFRIGYSWFK